MRAVTLKSFGGIENLVVSQVPKPSISHDTDVLIRVKATAVNRADTMQRKGLYAPPPGVTDIMGLEAAGVVEAVGDKVTAFKPGDRVMCILAGGGYAEYVIAHVGCVMHIPQSFDFVKAAAVPEVFLTAWQCLRMENHIGEGDSVLIHAGASGVGTAAAQLVERVLGGVAVTTSSEDKVELCKQFATHCVSRTPDAENNGKCFAAKVTQALGPQHPGVQLVIDPVFGGTYLQEDGEVLAMDGAITVLAFMGGSTIKGWNAAPFFRKRARVSFSTLRNRTAEYKTALVDSFTKEALPAFETAALEGKPALQPVISAVLPFESVAEAQHMVEKNQSVGKVILTL
mmetsp:Transcript_35707/g.41638  ORF Transcript_35707/g.41638 Transcript_35707/m.41638 type:complete len:342 (+) Transcript_35707:33-1058(+)